MDEDQDYELRRAHRKWIEEGGEQEKEELSLFDFCRFWASVCQDFGLGHYAPDVLAKKRGPKRKEPQPAAKQG